MNRIVAAAVLFVLGGYIIALVWLSYRKGSMPLLLARGSPGLDDKARLPFDRRSAHRWFWATLAINLATATGLVVIGILVLTSGRTP